MIYVYSGVNGVCTNSSRSVNSVSIMLPANGVLSIGSTVGETGAGCRVLLQKSDLAKTVLFSQIIIECTHSKLYHFQTYALNNITSIVVFWALYVM